MDEDIKKKQPKRAPKIEVDEDGVTEGAIENVTETEGHYLFEDTIRTLSNEGEPSNSDRKEKITHPCLVVLAGREAGKLFRIEKGESIIGRSPDADIFLNESNISREHAKLILDPRGQVKIEDLGSTNGTFLEGSRIYEAWLKPNDIFKIGSVTKLRFALLDEIDSQFVHQLYESASRDMLTGILNKRSFQECLARELAWHQRHDQSLTLILFDLDHFKRINDDFGHLAGDSLLKQVSSLCRGLCRTEDILARMGGDEFALILRSTNLEGGLIMAERLRSEVQAKPYHLLTNQGDRNVSITISLGVLTRNGSDLKNTQELIANADNLLYASKQKGRNQVSH